ncbi:MAG: O-antigen ligase family protein, partial [Lachnospiraceae bacterium]|nr:O-antigen ligase family protein [Lachnospiraceae bacterium]
SGYMILMFSIGYCGYINNLNSLRQGKQIEQFLFLLIGFATVLTQGSESGLVAGGVLLFIVLLYGIFSKQREIMIRIQNSYILLGTTGLVLSIISVALPRTRNFADESVTLHILRPEYWIVLLIVFLIFRILLVKSRVDLVMWAMLAIGILSILVLAWNGRTLIEEWGSGRSELWKVAWQGYLEMPIKNQLFGVGPDCFAPYLYEMFPEQMNVILSGWWGEAVIANAHNEMLNRLICTGLIGCAGFIWLISQAVILFFQNRNKSQYLVPFAIGLIVTMVHQFAGFQHVMLTPFVFLVMGMGISKLDVS